MEEKSVLSASSWVLSGFLLLSATGNAEGAATTNQRTSATASPLSVALRSKVRITIKNVLGKPLFLSRCRPVIQKSVDGAWKGVKESGVRLCATTDRDPIQIGARKSFTQEIEVGQFGRHRVIYRYATTRCTRGAVCRRPYRIETPAFDVTVTSAPVSLECNRDSDCSANGCYGEVCAPNRPIVTACIWDDDFSCLKWLPDFDSDGVKESRDCGCQANTCRWKPSEKYNECLDGLNHRHE
ncbi:MAG: hypothetical protein HYY84_16535 [Deltaproteobacteria bacterium]|nr:hypothetical protein [Deltaproteobacteria bacterium]